MGVDYSKGTKKEDENFLTDMIKRERKTPTATQSPTATSLRKRKIMSPAEAEEHKKQKREQKKQNKWNKFNYTSKDILVEALKEEEELLESPDTEEFNIHFVSGDVTKPQGSSNKIIVNCVDNSGQWGHGGLFSAIERLSSLPSEGNQATCCLSHFCKNMSWLVKWMI
jgi:PAB1-binding protein PBP1